MWVLVEPGDSAIVPSPSYPIHLFAPRARRRDDRGRRRSTPSVCRRGLRGIRAPAPAAGRHPLVSAQPDHGDRRRARPAAAGRLRARARLLLVHDFAYADIAFDGHRPPSLLEFDGALDCAVELYSLTKSFSMAGWRVGFVVGRADVVAALAKLKSYLDYGTFQPIQIASIVAMREAPGLPRRGVRDLPRPPRRPVRRPRPRRLARRPAAGDDVRLGADPGALPRPRLAGVRAAARRARPTSR